MKQTKKIKLKWQKKLNITKSYQPKEELKIKIHQSKELNIHQKKEYI